MASNLYNERSYKAADDIDAVSRRPSFTILIHPAYLAKDADSVEPVECCAWRAMDVSGKARRWSGRILTS